MAQPLLLLILTHSAQWYPNNYQIVVISSSSKFVLHKGEISNSINNEKDTHYRFWPLSLIQMKEMLVEVLRLEV